MPTTPAVELPYPVASDPADVPADIEALAMALDALLGAPAAEVWAGYRSGGVTIPGGSNVSNGADILGTPITFDAGPVAGDFLVSASARVWNMSVANAYSELSVMLDGAQHFCLGSAGGGAFNTPGLGVPLSARGVLRNMTGAHTLNVRIYGTADGSLGGGDGSPGADTPIVVVVEKLLTVPFLSAAARPGPDDQPAAGSGEPR